MMARERRHADAAADEHHLALAGLGVETAVGSGDGDGDARLYREEPARHDAGRRIGHGRRRQREPDVEHEPAAGGVLGTVRDGIGAGDLGLAGEAEVPEPGPGRGVVRRDLEIGEGEGEGRRGDLHEGAGGQRERMVLRHLQHDLADQRGQEAR